MSRLANKIAVVTAGGSEMGREIALVLAAAGARVAVVSGCTAGGDQAAVEINAAFPGCATGYGCEVADHAAARDLARRIGDELGPVNILVNIVGGSMPGSDLKLVFNTVHAFMRGLMKADDPRIINIAAVTGLSGHAESSDASAGLAGLIGLTKAIARELAGRGGTCNAVVPGFIATGMTGELSCSARDAVLARIPPGAMGSTKDIAAMVAFLASPAACHITGQVITIDGGMRM